MRQWSVCTDAGSTRMSLTRYSPLALPKKMRLVDSRNGAGAVAVGKQRGYAGFFLPEGERLAHVHQRVENKQTPCGQRAHQRHGAIWLAGIIWGQMADPVCQE